MNSILFVQILLKRNRTTYVNIGHYPVHEPVGFFDTCVTVLYIQYSCLVTKSCLTLVSPWTVAHQAPLSLGFPRKEYRSGLPFPPPEHLPNPGIKPTSPVSPALADRFFTTEPPGRPKDYIWHSKNQVNIQSTRACSWLDRLGFESTHCHLLSRSLWKVT